MEVRLLVVLMEVVIGVVVVMGEAEGGAATVVSSVVLAGLGGSLILPVGFLSAIGITVNGERTPGLTYG